MKCDTCGNTNDNMFVIDKGTRWGTFDTFECAIEAMAPTCAHCGCTILGHMTESDDETYCCAHCAESARAKKGNSSEV